MDLLRSRAVPALAALCLAGPAFAECDAIAGTYADESVEKIDGAPRELSAFAMPRDRSKIAKTEQSGPKPTLSGSGQVMSRPKTTKLVSSVGLAFDKDLKFKYIDAEGKVLLASTSTDPARWKCVDGRVERKFQMTSGIGNVIRTEEVEQAFSASPGGDLTLKESRKVIEGPAAAPQSREVHFKRK